MPRIPGSNTSRDINIIVHDSVTSGTRGDVAQSIFLAHAVLFGEGNESHTMESLTEQKMVTGHQLLGYNERISENEDFIKHSREFHDQKLREVGVKTRSYISKYP